MTRAVLAVTMGDPAGIGPEVAIRAVSAPVVRREAAAVLFGDLGVFRDTAARLGVELEFLPCEPGARRPRGAVPVCPTSELPPCRRIPGAPCAAGGEAAFRAIVAAADAVRGGAAAGMVTAPISKANLAAAGHRYPGHTELLAERAHARRVRMMMAGPRLRVVLVTIHIALRRVPRLLNVPLVFDTIALAHEALRADFGIRRPRVAVCGLNPHAGEGGLFGGEDERLVRPAVGRAVRRGMRVEGPLPADTVFGPAVRGAYDAVVCMYHDQGLAPFKLLHFADGVNVTLGLPFVRTSPDHGTAYDIAGRGCADPRSMIAAMRLAAELAARRARARG